MRNLTEPVGGIRLGQALRWNEVAPGDSENTFIVAVALQQGLAEGKERVSGDDVVLKDQTLFHVFEEPRDGGAHTGSAAKVRLTDQRVKFAFPVDGFEEVPTLSNTIDLTGDVVSRAIDRNVEVGGTDLSEPGQQCAQMIGPVKSDNQNWLSELPIRHLGAAIG